MHVVMLTNAIAPDKLGGLERYVRELAAGLVRGGCRVTVVAKQIDRDHPLDELAADGVRIIRYPVPTKSDPTFALRYPWFVANGVRRALQQAGPYSVLHVHFPVPALVPALSQQPYVYTLHAPVFRELLVERQGSYLLPGPVQGAAKSLLRRAERLVVARAQRVITLSEFMHTEVAGLDAGAGERTEILAGGVDTDRFTPAPHLAQGGDGTIQLFTARRLVPRTGVAQLVQAMPAVLAAEPRARLAIAGAGMQGEHIAGEIGRLGLSAAVTMLGRISDEELVQRYQGADLVITPTQELEGFGLATAEALACGTPCLVTPAGANPELVRTLSERLVATDCTPAAIAAATIALIEEPGLLAELRPRCRPTAHPAMGWSSIADRHLELYRGLPGAASSPRQPASSATGARA